MFIVGIILLWLAMALVAALLGVLVPFLVVCLTVLGAIMMWVDRPQSP